VGTRVEYVDRPFFCWRESVFGVLRERGVLVLPRRMDGLCGRSYTDMKGRDGGKSAEGLWWVTLNCRIVVDVEGSAAGSNYYVRGILPTESRRGGG
jgi:hypothetical protein